MHSIHLYKTAAKLADAVAARFFGILEAAIQSRGRASVALSGGSTPRALYGRLAHPAHRSWKGWRRLHVFWTDERAVSPTDEGSNYRLAREGFLDAVPIPQENVHRLRGESENLDTEARRAEKELDPWVEEGIPRIDLVLLGLGQDGHTASLFPGSPALRVTEHWITPAPGAEPYPRRLTMTFPTLNAGRHVFFLVVGDRKRNAVQEALSGAMRPEEIPAIGIRPTDGMLEWYLDVEAAAGGC